MTLKIFGKGMPSISIFLSALLSIISYFYIFAIGSYIKPTVWVLVDRVSYFSPFESYIIDKSIDHFIIFAITFLWLASAALSTRSKLSFSIVTIYSLATITPGLIYYDAVFEYSALLSLPIILGLLVLGNFGTKRFLVPNITLVVNYICLIAIVLGVLGIIAPLRPFYVPFEETNTMSDGIRSYAYEIFVVFSSLSPVFLVLMILCFPVKLIANDLSTRVLRLKNSIQNSFVTSKEAITPIRKIILLGIFICLSVSIAVIPHQKVMNIDAKDVGVDTHYYVDWITILNNSKSVDEFVKQAFVVIQHGDRPFTLLFLFIVSQMVNSENLSHLLDNVPIILGPVLILIVYFLTRELTSNDTASIFSAFLTAISFHTLVGIYAGSYANWLALAVGYASIIFLLRSIKKTDLPNPVAFFGLIIALLFTHIYTWTILVMVMGVYLLVLLKLNYYNRKRIIIMLIILSSSVLLDVVRMFLSGAYSGIAYDISPPFGSDLMLGLDQFSTRWSTIIDTTQNYYGSLFGNSIIYGLGLYWLFRSQQRDASTIFLMIFLSIGIIPLFFGNWSVQARVFYDIPFQIPAAIALASIYQKSRHSMLALALCIWLVMVAVQAVSNLYFVNPY